jgi:hypothetical protein
LILAVDQHGAEWSRSETDRVLDVAAPEADVGQRAVVEALATREYRAADSCARRWLRAGAWLLQRASAAGAASFELARRGAELWARVHSHGGLLRANRWFAGRFELAGLPARSFVPQPQRFA